MSIEESSLVTTATPTANVDSSTDSAGNRVHPLVAILIGGIVVRILLLAYFHDLRPKIVDELSYHQLARGLAATGQYVDESGTPTSLRPPLYPAVVAGVYRLFGDESFQAVRVLQIVLSLLTTLAVYLLGCELFSRSVALWAAAACCFYPSLLGFNNLLLSEVLFTLLMTLSVWLSTAGVNRRSLLLLGSAGLFLGLGALTRSILWLLAPVLGAWVLIAWPGDIRRRVVAAAVPLVVFAVTIGPWAHRNTQLHRTFTLIDVMGGRNVMMGNYEHTPLERSWATISIVTGEREWYRVLAASHPSYSGLTQGQIDKLAMKHGIRFALQHPGLTIKRSIVKFFNFWQLERTLVAGAFEGFWGPLSKVTIVLMALVICVSYAMTIFSAIFGLLCAPPTDRRIHGLLVLTILLNCGVHSIAFAHSRYHLPLIPILLLYAAAAWVSWPEIWRLHGRKFAVACGLCLLLAASWLREIVVVDLAKFTSGLG